MPEPANTPVGEDTSRSRVYLIGSAEHRHVKIGTTVNLARRVSEMSSMSPIPLELLWSAPGDHRLERALHERFHRLRRHGEWFDFGGQDPVLAVASAALELGSMLTPRPEVPEVRRDLSATTTIPADADIRTRAETSTSRPRSVPAATRRQMATHEQRVKWYGSAEAVAEADRRIAEEVAKWPPLSPGQKARLRAIFQAQRDEDRQVEGDLR